MSRYPEPSGHEQSNRREAQSLANCLRGVIGFVVSEENSRILEPGKGER